MSEKFGKVLESIYEENKAAVWNGSEKSESFESKMGVKQGCTLSPNLFALFIEDLIEFLPGGILISRTLIKALLFADDIILFAYAPETLQLMINRLDAYCRLWNLKVNLNKSKVMIFRNGSGRTARNEKWHYGREPIEIVKAYKYLGFTITSNLNMETHLKEKLVKSKSAISATWKKCFANQSISHSVKYKVFVAVAESIMMYAAQVWGGEKFETVEKLQRFYVKRCFRLPKNTPNYMISIETGLSPLFIKTLKCHVDYIKKILSMSNQRLPKILALKTIEMKNLWYKNLEELAAYCRTDFRILDENGKYCEGDLLNLISKLDEKLRDNFINEATSSVHRSTYNHLNHNLCERNYFRNENKQELISAIFKMRGELIDLNYIPHRTDLPIYCSLCNLRVREDVIHFTGKCPILSEIRRNLLGSNVKGIAKP